MATEVEVSEVALESEAQQETVGGVAESTQTTRKRKGLGFFNKRKDSSGKQSRRPPENKWLQQQIPACRPVFTAIHTFVGFLIIGIAFLILGSVFVAFSSRLREFEVDYTGCGPIDSDVAAVRMFNTCEAYLANISSHANVDRLDLDDCHCEINFTLPEDIRPNWNFYYGMKNYYQNHRRYLNSWDVNHLRGRNFRSPSPECRPFVRLGNLPVVPCGLIANSWFNDSFDVFRSIDDPSMNVTLDRSNIAWDTDRTVRFQNPGGGVNVAASELDGTIQPPNWPRNLSEITGGLQNESLMVWFRVSAFPWFKKLYGRPSVNGVAGAVLPRGNYSIILTYNYAVGSFSGKKSIIFAEVNWLGGRNLFLGIAYLLVGAFLIIFAFALLLMHKLCSKWKLSNAPFDN